MESTNEFWNKLFARRGGAIRPGLDRTRAALRHLGLATHPQRFLLIAGTNGKGTVAGILWQQLAVAGYRCGLFTSPHLLGFHERFRCSHTPITAPAVQQAYRRLQRQLPISLWESLSFFEVSTLLAISLFAAADCEVVVLEVGLGGRLDATNVVEPTATAVVSIDYDHQQWLGTTLPAIAREKLGITRRGVPLFWGETPERTEATGLLPLLRQQRRRLPTYCFGDDFWLAGSRAVAWRQGEGLQETALPLWVLQRPPAVATSFALASRMAAWFQEHHPPQRRPVAGAAPCWQWPPSLLARQQELQLQATTDSRLTPAWVDVGHNPAAAATLAAYLRQTWGTTGTRPGFVGMLADKDQAAIVAALAPVLAPLYFFRTPDPRAPTTSPTGSPIASSFAAAIAAAGGEAALRHGFVVTGSFSGVAACLRYFGVATVASSPALPLRGQWPRGALGAARAEARPT